MAHSLTCEVEMGWRRVSSSSGLHAALWLAGTETAGMQNATSPWQGPWHSSATTPRTLPGAHPIEDRRFATHRAALAVHRAAPKHVAVCERGRRRAGTGYRGRAAKKAQAHTRRHAATPRGFYLCVAPGRGTQPHCKRRRAQRHASMSPVVKRAGCRYSTFASASPYPACCLRNLQAAGVGARAQLRPCLRRPGSICQDGWSKQRGVRRLHARCVMLSACRRNAGRINIKWLAGGRKRSSLQLAA